MIFPLSCQKDTESLYPKNIIGKWNWIKTYAVRPYSDTNPLTPENTGNNEYVVFQEDKTWYSAINNIKSDSGRFSLGHGSYAAYPGATVHIYDSVAYYTLEGIALNKCDFYEIRNDTLQFCPGYGARFSSYTLPYNGSKIWVKDLK